jgi:hypothetical protein
VKTLRITEYSNQTPAAVGGARMDAPAQEGLGV